MEHFTQALKHIARANSTVIPTRDELSQFQHEDPYYMFTVAVMDAQAIITAALSYFKTRCDQHERLRTTRISSPGKRGNVDFHGIAASLVELWEDLVGALPNKKNAKFHALLQGAWTTIFGPNKRTPDWEGQTVVARRLATRMATIAAKVKPEQNEPPRSFADWRKLYRSAKARGMSPTQAAEWAAAELANKTGRMAP
jgi:hypothetical protein